MSSIAETTLSFRVWTEVVASSATSAYIQNKTAGRGMIWQFGSTLPSADSWVGHALVPGHPVKLTLPTGEALYMRQTDSGKAIKVTATTD